MKQELKISFQSLYRIGWYFALAMLVIIPVQIIIYVAAPPPVTVEGLFDLYRERPFLGLLSLDFLYLFSNLTIVFIYLALAAALFKEKPVAILLAIITGLLGIACYYPSNPAFEMLTLSKQYFQAAPEQANIYLAAGEALMAGYTGTTFNVYYVLSTICLLLFAFVLLKSPNFRKSIGIWGLISGFFMIVPSSAGTLGMIFSLLSLIPWIIFVALLMGKFKQLARPGSEIEPEAAH